jgi:hypothetical protein
MMLSISPNNGAGFTSGTITVTGVQLEKGTVATSFDYRPYGTEFALCQRYFTVLGGASYAPIGVGSSVSASSAYINISLPVSMRIPPALGSFSNLIITDRSAYDLTVTGFGVQSPSVLGTHVLVNNSSGATTNRVAMLNVTSGTNGFLQFNAEL